jgi:nitrite reductase (NO-forming)
MLRLTHPQSEIDVSLTHTVVVVFALVGLLSGMVAIGAAIYDGKDSTVVAGTSSSPPRQEIKFGAQPGDGWKPFDPALQRAPGRTEHELTIHAAETMLEVAPGLEQEMWTFNGQVPAPSLRGKVGDIFTITLVNDGRHGHSLDFHASEVAPNDEMRTIGPGESLVYQFEATHSGIWMYHCGTAPVLHHIANGMFGMVIVEPEAGLPPVDDEFFFVQNEWYLGPQGEVSSFAGANQAAPEPDFQMFNGVAAQYADNPINITTGEEVRMFVLNVGPSIDTSFHVVGTIFHDVTKEGVRLASGNEGNWGAQAVDLAPAQGAVIEMKTAEDGTYAFVNHAFNFPGRGAIGLFTAS